MMPAAASIAKQTAGHSCRSWCWSGQSGLCESRSARGLGCPPLKGSRRGGVQSRKCFQSLQRQPPGRRHFQRWSPSLSNSIQAKQGSHTNTMSNSDRRNLPLGSPGISARLHGPKWHLSCLRSERIFNFKYQQRSALQSQTCTAALNGSHRKSRSRGSL